MFRGASEVSLDSKGRLAIPKRYRDQLIADCDGQLVCTIDIHQPCLLLYPLAEWEVIERKLSRLSSMKPAERRIQRMLLGHATELELDNQGRVLLTGPLRNHAGLEGKIMLVGQFNKFEIWSDIAWQTQIAVDMETVSQELELTDALKDFSL
ncbi:division/cell wall cluster transcriptional repressor MraZ [Gallaecimonas pentaromativorans]|uniref:Transcriptional regulator MraZ n=1 Tax=Gallaecimonas pentaromativorans TaxID=584787 RepID=A0A3N1PRD1_9GAMM|nr:division/cell wall cluster transcriptional repressor MraZ [Gallaecimonas pentaromativorans]ROQ30779.1 MraZ protein [Gallaecimonas pentaromativorans]